MVPVLNRELRLGFTLPVELAPGMPVTEDAVEGRPPALGGCGKDAMLIVRRRDLSGLPGVRPLDADRTALLRFDVEFELDRGDLARDGFGLDGLRSLEGWYGDEDRGASGAGAVLFLGLGLGRGGRDPVGGFVAGRDGWGSADVEAIFSRSRLVVAMLSWLTMPVQLIICSRQPAMRAKLSSGCRGSRRSNRAGSRVLKFTRG